jgi:hypothetical protein
MREQFRQFTNDDVLIRVRRQQRMLRTSKARCHFKGILELKFHCCIYRMSSGENRLTEVYLGRLVLRLAQCVCDLWLELTVSLESLERTENCCRNRKTHAVNLVMLQALLHSPLRS